MRIAAAVILYHPDEETSKNILSYANQVQRIFILDNTEHNTHSRKAVEDVMHLAHAQYIHDGENKGISIRLNQAASLAQQEGFNWLLTMDQDSIFPPDSLSNYYNCLQSYPQKEKTAVFGVQFQDENRVSNSCQAEEPEHVITSGSILNLNLFNTIGPFDEALFIDKVDHEYCLRARAMQYKIVQFQNIYLHHNLGNITYGISLKTFKRTPRVLHSPIRMYYILRNYLYLQKKYPGQFEESFAEMKKELWLRTKNNFLYGKNRTKLIQYLLKGMADFKAGRMGKIKS